MNNGNEQSSKWGDKAHLHLHLRILVPLPSGANVAKTKPAIILIPAAGNTVPTRLLRSRTVRRRTAPEGTAQLRRSVAYTYSGHVLNIYSGTYRTGRATADHGGPR
jgi:hypothetical protein